MPETVEAAVEQKPQPDTGPSFQQFSDDRKAGKVDATAGGDEISPGGNQWDGDKNQFVNKTPRDDQGRFAKVRESLERSQKRSTFVKAVLEGAVEPDEHTMDADTWAAARNAQIERGINKITPPDFPAEKPANGPETPAAEAEPLTAEQIAHNAAHDEMQTRLRVRLETPEVKGLMAAMGYAIERVGATPKYFDDLGHFAADHPNADAILFHLGQNPEKLAAYTAMSKEQLGNVIRALSAQLAAADKKAHPSPPKPAPPEPVGARATATAFDVNDEKMDADEWARQRNGQVAKRRR